MRLFKTPVYTVAWAIVSIAMFVFLIYPSMALAAYILVWFSLVEAAAVADSDKGDTFSELIWNFYSERPARAAIVLGVVCFMCATVSYIFTGWDGWILISRISIVSALFVWLTWHFLRMGRDG